MRRAVAVCLGLAGVGCGDTLEPLDVAVGDGAAKAAWAVPATGERIELFDHGGGVCTPVTDVLFVVDPSISMRAVVDDVRAGFQELATSDVWPAKTRIGVMTTVPSLRRGEKFVLHDAVRRGVRAWAQELPGVMRLVDADGIEAFRKAQPERGARVFPDDGCDAWFGPTDTNSAGVPCLVAHTQLALAPFDVEPGLWATHGMVARAARDGRFPFRPGASVNVVFVSDTHDPGLANPREGSAAATLLARVPDAASVVEAIHTAVPVSAVRLHAIAPHTPCVEAWSPAGATYLEAAAGSGGLSLDVCEPGDYAAFLGRILEEGCVPTDPVLPLGTPGDVAEVRVEGRPTPFAGHPSGHTVSVPGLGTDTTREVEVRYVPRAAEPRPASPARPPAKVPPQPVEAPTPSSPALEWTPAPLTPR